MRDAITDRSFSRTRSHSAVLDVRIREMAGDLPPRDTDSWTARLPRFADPELGRYMSEIAAAMDDRQRRIGEHAAREAPLWVTQALGQLPDNPQQRAEWEAKAAKLGAYREMSGWDHPGEPIGPEPAPTFPEARAEWHSAFTAMARVEGIDVRGLTDGQLHVRRRAYEAETSGAPKHVAEELRAARRQGQFSRVEAGADALPAPAGQGCSDVVSAQPTFAAPVICRKLGREGTATKLTEEAHEASQATAGDLPGELADVLEVLRALTQTAGMSWPRLLATAAHSGGPARGQC